MSASEQELPPSFAGAVVPRSLGDGTFTADLRAEWSVGHHPHGGFLLALLAKAAGAALTERGDPVADPLAVSAEFLAAPAIGPVLLRTDIRKLGRRISVVAVRIEQRGRSCVEATVTAGRLPMRTPEWADLPTLPAKPPPGAIEVTGAEVPPALRHLGVNVETWVDRATAGFLTRRGAGEPPRMRLWTRLRYEDVDPYFALVAGDINPPVVLNLGRTGWAPTVQLSTLVRARPAPGWLRVQVDCRAVHDSWFDSDATVIDSSGRLIIQARQLALAPAP